MKKILLCLLMFALSIPLILTGCSNNNDSNKQGASPKDEAVLHVGVKTDVPKFGYQDPKTDKLDGFEIDIAKELAKAIKGDSNKIKLVAVDKDTRTAMLDNGEIDAVVATFTITQERENKYDFSASYYTDYMGLMIQADSNLQKSSLLNNKTIGVANNATARPELVRLAQTEGIALNFKEYNSYDEMKGALIAGQIDAFCADKSIIAGYLDDQTKLSDVTFAPQQYGVATKKGNDELTKKIDETIQGMISSGKMQELKDKWGL